MYSVGKRNASVKTGGLANSQGAFKKPHTKRESSALKVQPNRVVKNPIIAANVVLATNTRLSHLQLSKEHSWCFQEFIDRKLSDEALQISKLTANHTYNGFVNTVQVRLCTIKAIRAFAVEMEKTVIMYADASQYRNFVTAVVFLRTVEKIGSIYNLHITDIIP
tara:strand:- start:5977 stop:6468 length:492 start_codon:yes stop_codon:yes gene_type:complete